MAVICVQGLFTFCCLVLLLVRYLGFITEGNTYRCCATSSSPLGGNTDVVLANIIKGISGAVAGEDLQHNQVPNHKSHLLAIYIICHLPLVFLSPTSQKIAVLFASLFPFAIFLPDLFLSAILLCDHHDSREHQIMWFLKYQQQWFYWHSACSSRH